MAKKRKKKFRLQPRFFLTLVMLAGTAVVIVLLVNKIKGVGKEDVEAEVTPVPTATLAPTATPKPSLPPSVTVVRSENANPNKVGISGEILIGRKGTSSYSRDNAINFGRDSEYTTLPGLLTFGGNNYRNTFSYGVQTVKDKRLKEQWSASIGAIGNWSGTGWTGQPLIVHWPDETLKAMNVSDDFKTKEGGLTEIIYPAMDGNIYFLDLETGNKTRPPINTGVVQKGTACVDPNGNPVLYVGQGIPVKNEEGNNAAFVRAYSLIDQSVLFELGGFDWSASRAWQAYDGSAIINNDTIIYGGENGILYTRKLNTTFDAAAGTVSINPDQFVKFKYAGSGYSKSDAKDARWYGIESSVAAFRNYAFFTDNGGRLQCVDLNTMQLKYAVDIGDEADASVVIEESFDDNTIYLYTGSQTRTVGASLGDGFGYSYQKKINGLTGEIVWQKQQPCGIGDSSSSGGLVATPHVGRVTSNINNLVIYSLSLAALDKNAAEETPAPTATETPNPEDGAGEQAMDTGSVGSASAQYELGGKIVAYDKTTGEVMWTVEQEDDYWASPVVIYDENGKAYLIQCDRAGVVTLYDAATGTFLASLDLGSRIDSTPAVYDNYLIVGTRGKGGAGKAAKISCVKIS